MLYTLDVYVFYNAVFFLFFIDFLAVMFLDGLEVLWII